MAGRKIHFYFYKNIWIWLRLQVFLIYDNFIRIFIISSNFLRLFLFLIFWHYELRASCSYKTCGQLGLRYVEELVKSWKYIDKMAEIVKKKVTILQKIKNNLQQRSAAEALPFQPGEFGTLPSTRVGFLYNL